MVERVSEHLPFLPVSYASGHSLYYIQISAFYGQSFFNELMGFNDFFKKQKLST